MTIYRNDVPILLTAENHNMYSQLASTEINSKGERIFLSGYKQGLDDNFSNNKSCLENPGKWKDQNADLDQLHLNFLTKGYLTGFCGMRLEVKDTLSPYNNDVENALQYKKHMNKILYEGV